MAKLIYELSQVRYSYPGKFPALCGVDLNIEEGSKVAIIGANGSGKSTLLHLLDGLIFPESGVLRVFGRELKETDFDDENFSRGFRKRVGLVFQNPDVQLFCPTVKEDIVFGPLHLGVGASEIKQRLEELVGLLGISDLLERSPHQLSIGEKRKVAIASTLIIDPHVIILDEPTAGLDPLTTRHIVDFLLRANEAGKTIVTSTHDLHVAGEISDVVHVMSRDKAIVKSGPVDAIMKDETLLREHNLLHIHGHRHKGEEHVHAHQHLDHHH
jgi:cobalt/nickel transport system ATP-binding protein